MTVSSESLFNYENHLSPTLPWSSPAQAPKQELLTDRSELLSRLGTLNLVTVEHKVARILQQYPECRDSDTELAIRYWKKYQPDIISKNRPFSLDVLHDLQPMTTIVRCRQHVQNDLDLFQGAPRTRRRRGDLQMEFFQYLSEKKSVQPEITIYLDETGTDGQSNYMGIGGICVMDNRQYELTLQQFINWRESLNHPETLHFADANSNTADFYIQLANQISKYRTGLMFFGYATEVRGARNQKIADLIIQLTSDIVNYMHKNGCLNSHRHLRIIKEAEAQFDSMHLDQLQKDIADHLYHNNNSLVSLTDISTRPKGRDVLLECADVIASSMRRRLTTNREIHKDRISDAVFNATGLIDDSESSAVYTIHRLN